MKSLETFLSEQDEITIQELASYIQECIQEQWQPVLQAGQEEFLRMYERVSEGAAYGTYAHKLFQPMQEQLKRTGFSSAPGFPGSLPNSREWGPQQERERWMWSVVSSAQKVPLGTLVVRLVHDHTQFRLPAAPSVIALKEIETAAIVQAVSRAAGYAESEGE